MSYELADGSCSTDYKIGDEFIDNKWYQATLVRVDGELNIPLFNCRGYKEVPLAWSSLTPVNAKKHTSTINQLRETIKQLEATIKELER
jgi:small nuclear ribonucleoprotein (snRNP)-like protein